MLLQRYSPLFITDRIVQQILSLRNLPLRTAQACCLGIAGYMFEECINLLNILVMKFL